MYLSSALRTMLDAILTPMMLGPWSGRPPERLLTVRSAEAF